MKKKLVYLGWLIYRDILYSGIEGETSREQIKKIIRLNQFVILALFAKCIVRAIKYCAVTLVCTSHQDAAFIELHAPW